MRFALIMIVLMYVARKGGWLASRKVFYRESGPILVLFLVMWGVSMAWLVRVNIVGGNPGTINRWIFGYALGSYIAIPNYGLILESTIPDEMLPQHRMIASVPLFTYIVVSAALVFLMPARAA